MQAPVPVTSPHTHSLHCSRPGDPLGRLPLRGEGPAPSGGNRPREAVPGKDHTHCEARVPTVTLQGRIIQGAGPGGRPRRRAQAQLLPAHPRAAPQEGPAPLQGHPMRGMKPFPRHCHKLTNLTTHGPPEDRVTGPPSALPRGVGSSERRSLIEAQHCFGPCVCGLWSVKLRAQETPNTLPPSPPTPWLPIPPSTPHSRGPAATRRASGSGQRCRGKQPPGR